MDILSLGPWGNEKSRNWSIRFFEGQILKGFRVHHGYVVDRITFIMADKSSNHVLSEKTVGGDGGKSDEVQFNIASGEYITKISGTSANYSYSNNIRCITSLTIYTNLKKNGYGPYGLARKDGEHGAKNLSQFSSPTLYSNAIVGFHGGVHQYLESMGILVNPAPAKLGPWGDEKSQNWSFPFENQTLKGIKIRHGYVVDAIAFGVADQNYSVTWIKSFGGEGGKVDEFYLGPDEFITQISGTFANFSYFNNGRCVASIIIHTNKKPNGYGPYGLGRTEGQYGSTNVTSFSSPLISDDAIIGFHGGQHGYLQSIGIFVAPVGKSSRHV